MPDVRERHDPAAARRRFNHSPPTGRWLEEAGGPEPERKSNPCHDPENGRFTFAPGHPLSPSGVIVSDGRANSRATSRLAGQRGSSASGAKPYLSELHNELNAAGTKHPPAPGTREWTAVDAAAYLAEKKNILAFKAQWVRGYRNAIKNAAARFDIPPELLAGVAFTEVGGDPHEADAGAYALRTERGRNLPLPNPLRSINRPRDTTSFGDMSIQIRRAAQSLGYGTDQHLSETQRRSLMLSLRHPSTSIFIAAKHLSDLRDVDSKGRGRDQLTRHEIALIAARYNQGPDNPREQVAKDLSYGRSILARWRRFTGLLAD